MSSDEPTRSETAQLIRGVFERTEAPLGAIHRKGPGTAEAYQRAFVNLFVAHSRRKQEWSESDVTHCLYLIGSPWPQLSRYAAAVFLSLEFKCHDPLFAVLDKRLNEELPIHRQEQLIKDYREALSDECEGSHINLVRACRNSQVPPDDEVLPWLEHEGVRFCSILSTPSLQIHMAKLVSEAERFNGAWMELSANKHVILVGALLEDKVSAVLHELEHLLEQRVLHCIC
ncbi:MAG TPA: hypothetical protein VMY37_20345 [Thermoguttaceae bacterium]|nr:hypothetical protein [Thermoguttaceae bacterium]